MVDEGLAGGPKAGVEPEQPGVGAGGELRNPHAAPSFRANLFDKKIGLGDSIRVRGDIRTFYRMVMNDIRRAFIKIGSDLAVDFANTVYAASHPAGTLHGWRDLIDFLELRGALTRIDGAGLRAMGEKDARRCAAAFGQGLQLRETVRVMLGAMAAKRPLQAKWVTEVNQALSWGAGADRLVRDETGWRLGFAPDQNDPLRVLAPIARSIADLAALGRAVEIRKCANPRCVLYFRDGSRARRRRWCSMAVCGNRMKVAAHFRRHGRRRPA